MRVSRVHAIAAWLMTGSLVPVWADGPTGGVEVGANFTSLSVDLTGVSSKVRPGLLVGGFGLLPVGPAVSIQPEVVYTQKYSRLAQGSLTFNEKLDFIEIPILLRVNLSGSSSPGFYGIVGPGFDFSTRAKEGLVGSTVPEKDIKDQVVSTDVSILAGAGVTVGKIAVEGRYDGGLRNLNKKTGPGEPKIKSRTFTVLGRVHF
jgi:hypothetical protein